MAYIFQAPFELAEVANLITSIGNAFYASKNWGGGSAGNVRVGTAFWTPDDINTNTENIPSGTDLARCYQRAAERRALGALAPIAPQFACAVNVERWIDGGFFSAGYWDLRVKTRVFNKSLLEDLLSGQPIPAVVREYVIVSYDGGWKYYGEWIAYRDRMLLQAQERLRQRGNEGAKRLLLDD